MMVAFGNRDPYGYYIYKSMRNSLVNGDACEHKTLGYYNLEKVYTYLD